MKSLGKQWVLAEYKRVDGTPVLTMWHHMTVYSRKTLPPYINGANQRITVEKAESPMTLPGGETTGNYFTVKLYNDER